MTMDPSASSDSSGSTSCSAPIDEEPEGRTMTPSQQDSSSPSSSTTCSSSKKLTCWSASSAVVFLGSCCVVLLSVLVSTSSGNNNNYSDWFQSIASHNNNAALLSKLISPFPKQKDAQRRQLLEVELPRHNDAASIRIFGPVVSDASNDNANNNGDDNISTAWYTRAQQRQFLQQYGQECWPNEAAADSNTLVQRFDEFSSAPFLQTELWKFCVFSTGMGNLFWDRSQMVPTVTWEDVFYFHQEENNNDQKPTSNTAILVTPPPAPSPSARGSIATAASASSWIHPSFLKFETTMNNQSNNNNLAQTMIRLLMETEDSLLKSNPLYTYQALAQHIQNNNNSNNKHDRQQQTSSMWSIWDAKCQVPSPQNPADQVLVRRRRAKKKHSSSSAAATTKQQQRQLVDAPPLEFSNLPTFGLHCTQLGGYCCQVWNPHLPELPVMMLQHPFGTTGGITSTTTTDDSLSLSPQQHQKQKQQRYPISSTDDEDMHTYWSTITAVPTSDFSSAAVSKLETPNFFDILLQNNCLPTSEACHKCLKRYISSTGCDDQCRQDCPCYCKVLCQIRPPPKHVQAVWYVSPPLYQLQKPLPPRLIPRIVHQTWYEPLEKEKYPNMSRLQQSWKQSGWKHVFYDDATAAKFLQEHFPPEVLEAHSAIQPGAFKADLFRYCVLLIQGGVYADMDVLLETNLEEAIAPNVGFMTPMDEPGIKVDHQACLWNGFMAVAPGHPFVAKTIELVVNNIRNRFTSVDYDDMLCPDPILSASHLWDILFTTGPCILGTAMNLVLQRHPQTGFKTGEIDIWGAEQQQQRPQQQQNRYKASQPPPMVEPNDPRLAIPGRSIILRQNKEDMGAHRFTLEERNLVVCSTDMPDYDDRPKKPHYAESGKQTSLYGTTQLYSDFHAANEEIKVVVVGNANNYTM